ARRRARPAPPSRVGKGAGGLGPERPPGEKGLTERPSAFSLERNAYGEPFGGNESTGPMGAGVCAHSTGDCQRSGGAAEQSVL
ncbi:MAG: hypothetical protein KJ626_13805, partial [Verrucomicrobia bacterium]|nr:hypothetical protein [Verrucomicrobiota bacterium]